MLWYSSLIVIIFSIWNDCFCAYFVEIHIRYLVHKALQIVNAWHGYPPCFESSSTHPGSHVICLSRRSNRWFHDDVIKWKHVPRHWPFVGGIHRSLMNSPPKGQWSGALVFSLICAWTKSWANNGDAGDLRRHRAHYDVIVMFNVWCARFGFQYNCDVFILMFKHAEWIKWIGSATQKAIIM